MFSAVLSMAAAVAAVSGPAVRVPVAVTPTPPCDVPAFTVQDRCKPKCDVMRLIEVMPRSKGQVSKGQRNLT
jgi:hypothetical protein